MHCHNKFNATVNERTKLLSLIKRTYFVADNNIGRERADSYAYALSLRIIFQNIRVYAEILAAHFASFINHNNFFVFLIGDKTAKITQNGSLARHRCAANNRI